LLLLLLPPNRVALKTIHTGVKQYIQAYTLEQELQAMPEALASTLDSSTVDSRRGSGNKAADIEKANSQT
jgi:hypothetical protein